MDRRTNHKGRMIFKQLQVETPVGLSIYKERVNFDKHHIHVVVDAPQTTGPINLTININDKKEGETEKTN